jgi:hypothetical protein
MGALQLNLGLYSSLDERRGSGQARTADLMRNGTPQLADWRRLFSADAKNPAKLVDTKATDVQLL